MAVTPNTKPSSRIAARLTLVGRVQGIGLRPAVARFARQLTLDGHVSNTKDGVEIHVEGRSQDVERFEREDRFWLGIAPEGTRTRVERWKPGFWKIASAAGVPVLPAYFHYPEKIIGIGEPFQLTGDMDADMARITVGCRQGAEVYIGGQYAGDAPVSREVPPGRYAVAIVAVDGRRKTVALTVEAGDEVRRTWDFDRMEWR